MTTKTETVLVLQPDVTFMQITSALERLGWTRGRDTLAAPPIIPGEPEFASWSANGSESRISYTFNPVVNLRVLVFYGGQAGEHHTDVACELPTLGIADLRSLLRSDDVRTLLLGVFATRELRAFQVLDLIEGLCAHKHVTVSAAAQEAYAGVMRALLESGAAQLKEEKRHSPERSILFPNIGDAHMRRQTLRWLIRDYSQTNEHITSVLRSGLADVDWEVRATAMLAAARLKARVLVDDVSGLDVLRIAEGHIDEADRNILVALHTAVLADMRGMRLPSNDDPDLQLRRCVAGLPPVRFDRSFLFVNALTQPLEVEEGEPELPAGIVGADGDYSFARSGIPLSWIAPLPHWLGADDADLPIANPIRRETSPRGFFITKYPLSVFVAERIISREGITDFGNGPGEQTYLCPYSAALDISRRLGQIEGLSIALPAADQWEMAARGTDGRRYPWGNGFEDGQNETASPWGLENLVGEEPEWTRSVTDSGAHITCGGGANLRCAARAIEEIGSSVPRHGVRLVVVPR